MSIALLLGATLAAQTPDTAGHARLRALLSEVNDSLSVVRATGSAFTRDLGTASPQLVSARAARVHGACQAAARAAARLDRAVRDGTVTSLASAGDQRAFRAELASLRGTLARCEREFAPDVDPADARAAGPHRLDLVERAIRRYLEHATRYGWTPRPPARRSAAPGGM
jgi:hypothetical protein